MLHELRCYTTKPGGAPEVIKANAEVGRKVRGDDYGTLVGYWYTDIGPLNQVVHLWQYDSYEERERMRKALGALPAWRDDYVARVRPHIVEQSIRFLTPVREVNPPAGDGHFYEFRNYVLSPSVPGAANAWVERAKAMLPAREKYSPCVAMWATQAPNPNEVCHLWAYKDTNERKQVRDAAAEDPDFKAFAQEVRPMMVSQHSIMMWPVPFSPLQ